MTVYVNAIMYYKVFDAASAVANVDDYGDAARQLAATTLRNVLGTMSLGDVLSERESIANEIQVFLMMQSHLYMGQKLQEGKTVLWVSLNSPHSEGPPGQTTGSSNLPFWILDWE